MEADRKFLVIAITKPDFFDGEAEQIATLLEDNVDYVHIRKPRATVAEIRELIQAVPAKYHHRLRIHDHFVLATEFGLAGVHINGRNPAPPVDVRSVTRSCHSIGELHEPAPSGCVMEYQTLSPIFDSISKPGYQSGFNLDEIRESINGLNVIALGGVTRDRFPELAEAGFAGAAMLGAAWL